MITIIIILLSLSQLGILVAFYGPGGISRRLQILDQHHKFIESELRRLIDSDQKRSMREFLNHQEQPDTDTGPRQPARSGHKSLFPLSDVFESDNQPEE
ncbi:MAG: hypothetical protein ACC642_00070 [Pseudomonadales bacterium]